jgi:hypothetical protein
VHVKVIGSGNSDFQSGETDLRGIFVADDIRGTSTVIARSGKDRYAFYRGKTYLGPQPQPNASPDPAAQAAPAKPGKKAGAKDKLLDNVLKQNSIINREQRMNYDNLINNGNQGIRAEKAF